MFAICVFPSPNDDVWDIESWCESTLLSCLILQLWQSAYVFLDVFLGSLITCKTMHLYKSHYRQAAPLCKARAKHGQGNQSMLNQNKIQLSSENPQTTCCIYLSFLGYTSESVCYTLFKVTKPYLFCDKRAFAVHILIFFLP